MSLLSSTITKLQINTTSAGRTKIELTDPDNQAESMSVSAYSYTVAEKLAPRLGNIPAAHIQEFVRKQTPGIFDIHVATIVEQVENDPN